MTCRLLASNYNIINLGLGTNLFNGQLDIWRAPYRKPENVEWTNLFTNMKRHLLNQSNKQEVGTWHQQKSKQKPR